LATTPLVVLDTNVLVAGLCRRIDSPSFKILQNIQKAVIPLALTQKLYLEYESVLTRRNILKLIGASKAEILSVLEALLVLAYQSEVYYLWRPNLPDEDDNFVLEAAVAANALVVTKNTTDFRMGELEFPDLIVLTPQQFCDQYL
jgi:putative PIN family toxin of toxin-antitoxin system|tara:strand:+ start:91 stop:525 length:435 start_codon:yes stop_codon:yes gene_type:complete